jgi:hypothetical protein
MKTIRDHQQAIDCVASIPVHWNADGSVKHCLLDRDDAELVVRALIEAGLVKADRTERAKS